MLTPKRMVGPLFSGDAQKDFTALSRAFQDYLLSLEHPGAITLTEGSVNGSPIGEDDPDTGKFTTLEVTTSSTFPTGTAPNATVTAGAGTFTTVSGVVSYTKVGDRILFRVAVTITTNGTAATYVNVAMPINAAEVTGFGGVTATGVGLAAAINAGNLTIFKYDGTYPGADGVVLYVSGSYRV
jgi:hypothetical protein